MDNKIDDELKEDLILYKRVLEKHPEIASALEENQYLKQEKEDDKKLKRMLAHELKNPLNGITGLASIIKDELYSSEEEKKEIFELLCKSVSTMNTLIEILYLDGSSKEELQRKAEVLVLENIAKEHAIMNSKDMKNEKIGLRLKYNRLPYNKPLEIYANKAVINAIWGTLFGNSLAWAPQFSKITQGFRINKVDNLEIIMENVYSEKKLRESKGMGNGIGTPFVKDIVKTLKGNFQKYQNISQIKKDYDMDEWLGYKETRNTEENKKIYGVRITIPMSEISKSKTL